jgi:hypothetical protein
MAMGAPYSAGAMRAAVMVRRGTRFAAPKRLFGRGNKKSTLWHPRIFAASEGMKR